MPQKPAPKMTSDGKFGRTLPTNNSEDLILQVPKHMPPPKYLLLSSLPDSRLQVIRKFLICNCPELKEKDEDEERGRKHGTSKHQALVAENTPPAGTRGHHQAPGAENMPPEGTGSRKHVGGKRHGARG